MTCDVSFISLTLLPACTKRLKKGALAFILITSVRAPKRENWRWRRSDENETTGL